MWSRNTFSERLNLKWPILQAPMGDLSTPALASAVSNAGALGGLGMWGVSAEDAGRRVAGFRQQSSGSLNVNYPLWDDPGDLTNVGRPMRARIQGLYDEAGLGQVPAPKAAVSNVSADHLAMLHDTKPDVVSFHFGLPAQEIVRSIKAAGILIISSATTVAEAKQLEERGVDAVIAQGTEAGSHRGTFSGVDISMQPALFALVPQVVDAVRVPVVAAGGIADGRGIAAAFMLGASAVQLGTAFLRCAEANLHPSHRAALASAGDSSTVMTTVVSGRPARFIRNRLVQQLSLPGAEPLPFPAQLSLTYPLGASGNPDLTVQFAGQSVSLTREMSAGDLVETLAEETTQRLKAFA
jgi:nitronate monooxygenase